MISKKKPIPCLLIVALMLLPIFIGTANAATYYTIQEIPKFNKSEQEILADFGIKFRPYNSKTSIRTHNRSVAKLVKNYGDNWRDTLQLKMTNSGTKVTSFLKYLVGNGGKRINGKSIRLTYKKSGYITCVRSIKYLRNEGASMVHRRITTQTYTIKGRRLKRESYVMQGSGCCFTADTKILMCDNSQKPIAELMFGDSIKTFNRVTKQLENSAVKQCINIRHENLYQLNFSNFKLTTTADHPFLLKSGWGAILPDLAQKYLKNEPCVQIDLNANFMTIANGLLSTQKLESIRLIPEAQMTYTINELSEGDTFVANGLIVAVESLSAL